ncbi:MAG: CDP-alcohol phosphatidyltransferase family protein [Deltaproteobacteria bacterium]|nr:CDP-alcohol phosphatidyltransferase family protein [Deltaproteobacteria bacterium]MBK8241225.1 CDP-alcohol phosphatidyltransferase family protein [Deltaproteobacteria bacterium]MBK8716852.1 CDP-alcohol phosphatidyltransferase family protein [Deltaproteobacteria bacterium]MBP7286957.1 CDP-alcohol phosphatidyltransferase family protein [Nannocystaceae bacterium]
MPLRRFLRYVAPNLVTAMGMAFGLSSLVASYEHRLVDAAWLIIWAVLADRLDGLVARSLRATSDFGVQMDSFADATNFGVAPAFLVFVTLEHAPAIGFASGSGRMVLLGACGLWALANVFRLAKFNVVAEAPSTGLKVFFGVPTTLAAGVLIIWYLVLAKYAPAEGPLTFADPGGGPRLLGALTIPSSVWSYVPAAMIAGAFLMASNLPIPKLQGTPNRVVLVVMLALVGSGYVCGMLRTLPEYMAVLPSSWLVVSLVWGQMSNRARSLAPPPVLPDPGPLRQRR